MRKEEVLLRVQQQRIILHDISKRKAKWISHILRRNCLLQRVIEGKIKGEIEVTGRRERRLRKLLDGLKERRGYFHLKEETLDRGMWGARFGRGFGPLVRQTSKCINMLRRSLLRLLSSWTEHSRLVVRHCRNSSVLSLLLALFRCACVSSFSILVHFFEN